MKKKTDLEEIKQIAKDMIYIGVDKVDEFGIIPNPFTASRYVLIDNELVSIGDLEILNDWANSVESRIDDCQTLERLVGLLRKPYYMVFFKLIKPYLSKRDFSILLSMFWTMSENPNMDHNVNLGEVISWFKYANPRFLMNNREYKIYNDTGKITLYRGVSDKSQKYGLSWTDDCNVAKWFAERFQNPSCILKVEASHDDILAYFDCRGEKEYVVNIRKVKNKIEIVP